MLKAAYFSPWTSPRGCTDSEAKISSRPGSLKTEEWPPGMPHNVPSLFRFKARMELFAPQLTEVWMQQRRWAVLYHLNIYASSRSGLLCSKKPQHFIVPRSLKQVNADFLIATNVLIIEAEAYSWGLHLHWFQDRWLKKNNKQIFIVSLHGA